MCGNFWFIKFWIDSSFSSYFIVHVQWFHISSLLAPISQRNALYSKEGKHHCDSTADKTSDGNLHGLVPLVLQGYFHSYLFSSSGIGWAVYNDEEWSRSVQLKQENYLAEIPQTAWNVPLE